MRILSWNLFHGRALPPAGRDLMHDFSARLAGWEWDVALLQEVPPWWPPALARRRGRRRAHRADLAQRPARAAARARERWPDIVKSEGGGSNAILVRGERIEQHVVKRVATKPERRVMHGVRLAGGTWVVNQHLTAHHPEQADAERAAAGATAQRWAGAAPIVFGGDLNRAQGPARRVRARGAQRRRPHLRAGPDGPPGAPRSSTAARSPTTRPSRGALR